MKRSCLILFLSSLAFGQGVILPTQQALKTVNGITAPLPNATITVCAANTSGIPCLPVLSSALFKDAALTQPLSNPFTADANGNYVFAIAPGNYTVTVTGLGFVGYSYQTTAPLSASATNTFTSTNTFTGATNLNGGGALVGTFTGPATFSGNNTFTALTTPCNLDNIKYVDTANRCAWSGSDLAAWISSAFASCASTNCTVVASAGSYSAPTSGSITVGVSPCVNPPTTGYAQTLIVDFVQVTVNNPVKINCGGVIKGNGDNLFGTQISAGVSLPSGPLIDIGDNVNVINAGISGLRIHCQSVAGCTGIRARGINDNSYITNNIIQSYLVNGVQITGTTVNTGNFNFSQNFIAGATGASDGILLTNVGGGNFQRNSIVSNSGIAIAAACIHVSGTLSPASITFTDDHCENHTDEFLVDGATGLTVNGGYSGGSPATTNGVHIATGATGVVTVNGFGTLPVDASHFTIKNDITSNTIAANAFQHGVAPTYLWVASGNTEVWCDSSNCHYSTPSGNPILENSAQFKFRNTAATETAFVGIDAFATAQFGAGTSTAHQFSLYSNGLRRLNIQPDGGVGFTEIAAPSSTAGLDVLYGDSTAHALKLSNNNSTFFNVTQTIASGTAAMTTAAIAAGACGTTVTVAAANVATTDTITWAFNAAPGGQNAGLVAWPTSGNVNFAYCSNTAETPAAATINWRVIR